VDVIHLEELAVDEKTEKTAIEYLKFVIPLMHYFLWQNGAKMPPEIFRRDILTTTFFCNFLLQYAQIDVRDSAKHLENWIEVAFDDDVMAMMFETNDAGNI